MWNYFFIKWICDALNERILSYKIGEIFSQNRDEIIFGFYKEKAPDFYWILSLDPAFPHMRFSDQFSRAKRNSADLFQQLVDKEIEKIEMHPFERSFHFELGNNSQLIFKLHGGISNVILKSGSQVELFKSKIKNDLEWALDNSEREAPGFEIFKNEEKWQRLFPYFDKRVKNFIENGNFNELDKSKQWEKINTVQAVLEKKQIHLFKENHNWYLHQLAPQNKFQTFTDPFEACNTYSSKFGKELFVEKEKQKMLKNLDSEIKKIDKSLFKLNERKGILENNNEWEENANLIMANLHLFSANQLEVELFDFYHDCMKKIKIKQGQSPQKFAEVLYKKSKNKQIEINNIIDSIKMKLFKKKELSDKKNKVEAIEESSDFKDYFKRFGTENKLKQEDQDSVFKEFKIAGYDIFVGRNAKNNDILTTKFAKKDDIWMHAKDVAGSHLIIRRQGLQKVPINILEKAASIAAWYSKGKNDTFFPVIYTERKYVRKGKGLAPGKVKVDKHDVLIVKPELPKD